MAKEAVADEATEEAPKKSGMMKNIMLGVGVVVLVVAGQVASPIIQKMINGEPPPAEAAPAAAAPAVADTSKPAIYHSLYPPLVANFKGGKHFAKVAIDVVTRDSAMEMKLKEHDSALRNSLILYFSDADYEKTKTREGIDELRAGALKEVQMLLTEMTGEPGVDQLYFTTFIVQ